MEGGVIGGEPWIRRLSGSLFRFEPPRWNTDARHVGKDVRRTGKEVRRHRKEVARYGVVLTQNAHGRGCHF